jgi:TatD DNase family protein
MKYNFLIDSHCHLDLLEEKGENATALIKAAKEKNVKYIQTICTKITEFNKIYSYAENFDNVFASIGIHPCNVDQQPAIDIEEIIKICQERSKLIGIGETGLDYFHDTSAKNQQIESFLKHIEIARQTGLVLIIHSRNADKDMADILEREMKKQEFKALMHCFSSSEFLAKKSLELNISISISGIVTFKNAIDLQDIVKIIPKDKILVETDAPYLAPTPYRGKINKPEFTYETAKFIANLKNIEEQEFFSQTTDNFCKLFEKFIPNYNLHLV